MQSAKQVKHIHRLAAVCQSQVYLLVRSALAIDVCDFRNAGSVNDKGPPADSASLSEKSAAASAARLRYDPDVFCIRWSCEKACVCL